LRHSHQQAVEDLAEAQGAHGRQQDAPAPAPQHESDPIEATAATSQLGYLSQLAPNPARSIRAMASQSRAARWRG